MEIHEGRRLTLKCKVQGETNPQIKWFKDDKPIDMSVHPNIKITSSTKHSELRIEQVISSDSGNYSCRGESHLSQISKWVFVSVYSACPVNVCNIGTCFVINNNSLCRCPKTHTGEHCEHLISNTTGSNKLFMNTQPIKQHLNHLQSDSKSSLSSSADAMTSVFITNENNNPHQNVQPISEMKREKFDLCSLPEFQFTTDCVHVKSHLMTFIGTAITCSMLILLLTFCAAYFRRRRILNRGKSDRQQLSKENQSKCERIIESTDDKSHSPMLNSAEMCIENGSIQLSPLKSVSFEGVLYTDMIKKNDDMKQPNIPNSDHTYTSHNNSSRPNMNNTQTNDSVTDNSLCKRSKGFQVSPSSSSNTAYVVWTTTQDIIQQPNQELNICPLSKILIHTDAQQQYSMEQNLATSAITVPTTTYHSANVAQSLSSHEMLLNNVSSITQNNYGTLLSPTTYDNVTSSLLSRSKLSNPIIAQSGDVTNKAYPVTNILLENTLESSIHHGSPVGKTKNRKDTILPYAYCTNLAYNSSMTDSLTSNLSRNSTENHPTNFTPLETLIPSVETNECIVKQLFQTTKSLSISTSTSPQPCIILDPDNLKFSSKLVYFCPNTQMN